MMRSLDVLLVYALVLSLAKAALMRWLALGGVGAAAGVWLEACVIVVSLALGALAPRRIAKWAIFSCYLALSLAFVANAMYASYFEQVFDPQLLAMAAQVTSVGDVIAKIITPVDYLFVIDIPLVAAWVLFMRFPARGLLRRRWLLAATGIASALFVAQAAYALVGTEGMGGAAIARARGLGAMQAGAIGRYVANRGQTSEQAEGDTATRAELTREKLREALGPYAVPGTRIADFYPGAMRGRPIIIVQFEALQSMLIDAKVEGSPVAPNVSQLAAESWYFPNFYSQTGLGNTADAEFTAGTSLLPPLTNAASVAYADKAFPAYPRLLRRHGYWTTTVHANEAAYWNRQALYPALGFNRYYERRDLGNDDIMWKGVSDEVLFQKALGLIEERRAIGKPYALQIITLSSHTPFIYPPKERRPLQLSDGLEKSFAGQYVTAVSYTDKALGEFINGLKTSGVWDEAVVIVYGDHMGFKDIGAKGADGEIIQQLLGRPYSYADRQRVPLIIHLPGQTQGVLSEGVRGMQDTMPTICDLVGIDTSLLPHIGLSVFQEAPRIVPLRAFYPGGSFVSDAGVFVFRGDPKASSLLRIADGTPLPIGQRQIDDIDRIRKLNVISDEWARGMPVQSGTPSTGAPIIPTGGASSGSN